MQIAKVEKNDQPITFYSDWLSKFKVNANAKKVIWIAYGLIPELILNEIIESIDESSIFINASLKNEGPVKNQLNIHDIDNKFYSISAKENSQLVNKIMGIIDINSFHCWKPVMVPEHEDCNFLYIKDFYQELGSQLNFDILNRNTLIKTSNTFLKNSLVNIILNSKGKALSDLNYSGKPVLLVSAGPSLDKQLDNIKRYRDVFFIICVGTAYPALEAFEIMPDAIVATDPGNRSNWGNNTKSKIVIDAGVDPALAWKTPENLIFTTHHSHIYRVLEYMGNKIDFVSSGGSVATTAFNVAKKIGAKVIIFVGQDLSYSIDADHSKFHSPGTSINEQTRAIERALAFEGRGYYDDSVIIPRDMMMFKHWFEQQISDNSDLIVFNCTEGGAFIKGAQNLPFIELARELEKFVLPIAKNDLEVTPKIDEESFHFSLEKLKHLIDSLNILSIDVKRVLRHIDSGKKSTVKLLENIDSLNHVLKSLPVELKSLLEINVYGEIKSLISSNQTKNKSLTSEQDAIINYKEIFLCIDKGLKELKSDLKVIFEFYKEVKGIGSWDYGQILSNKRLLSSLENLTKYGDLSDVAR